jgi:hypothetical protein
VERQAVYIKSDETNRGTGNKGVKMGKRQRAQSGDERRRGTGQPGRRVDQISGGLAIGQRHMQPGLGSERGSAYVLSA